MFVAGLSVQTGRERRGPPLALSGGVLPRARVWVPLLLIGSYATAAWTRGHPVTDEGRGGRRAYLEDAAFRRGALAASLATTQNRYAETRLQHYGRTGGRGWEALREWNPAVEPIAAAEIEAPSGADLQAWMS